MSCSMEYPFGQFGSVVLATFPPNLLPAPSLLAEKSDGGGKLMLCKHPSAMAKALVYIINTILATDPKHKIVRAVMKKVNSMQDRPSTLVSDVGMGKNIFALRKSNGEWRLTVDYRGLNEVTPPMSAAMLDMLELQYELESKAAKWYATTDIANAFFLIPLAAECRPQFASLGTRSSTPGIDCPRGGNTAPPFAMD
ncbi:hypothetical protein GRJ2_001296300 [Grus japonensis]|uniref:Reverse transcriptase n=1 Tax=Grus japonensis TaxID=30415 RepID=A0ABC9WT35_GRUJA